MSRPIVPASYRALIDSPRVSTGTRGALQAREVGDDPHHQPTSMTPEHLEVLRAMIRRLVPQREAAGIDLAARLDAQLGSGPGDGWRHATLPDDRTAYARGLSVLDGHARAAHGRAFAELASELQDGMLASAAAGELDGSAPGLFDGARMKLWFEDVLTDAVRLYVAHPATLARIGYSGIGYGGDGDAKPGFTLVGLGERESWEPLPETAGDAG